MSAARRQYGFSLIELMISLTILTILSGSILVLVRENQQLYHGMQDYAAATQSARISLDLIARYVRQAGNNPLNATFSPLSYSENTLTIRSDLTGSQAAQSPLDSFGDPDKQLTAAFEQITVRYDSQTKQVLLDAGYGEDTLAENIGQLRFDFYDSAGVATTDMSQVTQVAITLEAVSALADPQTKKANSITLSTRVYLRSKTASPLG
ncbi:MAG: prepilin-type N-terminal cleavage/methylation domain-containing protein [Acidobacteria bacterium]|nr:prepilin-type N-terminal cleavage/methylation domain-containing protein [Acidobacteriota bacterium]